MASQPGTEDDEGRSARWHSETGAPPPQRVVVADDRTTADGAYRPLRRAPDVREACAEVHCPASEPLVISLRE